LIEAEMAVCRSGEWANGGTGKGVGSVENFILFYFFYFHAWPGHF
jgi:hypothetical protein